MYQHRCRLANAIMAEYKWDLVQEEPIKLVGNDPNRARFFVLKKEPFLKFVADDEIWWNFTENPQLLDEINKYVSEHKPAELRRGDVVALPSQNIGGTYPSNYGYNYRNDGKMIYDGEKLVDLRFEEDDYGMLPDSFTIAEFDYNSKYWDDVIAHNGFFWMDISKCDLQKIKKVRTRYAEETYYVLNVNETTKFYIEHSIEFGFEDDLNSMLTNSPTLFEKVFEVSDENIAPEHEKLPYINIIPRYDQYKKNSGFKSSLKHTKHIGKMTQNDTYVGKDGKYICFRDLCKTKALETYFLSEVTHFETKDQIPSDWVEVDNIDFIRLLPINPTEMLTIDRLVKRMIFGGVE